MLYSCELLDHHVKMSTEGFGTTHCFLKQIVTKPLNLSSSTSKQAVSTLSLFFPPTAAQKKDPGLCFHSDHPVIKKGPIKYYSVSSFRGLNMGVVLYWCTGGCQVFNLAAAVKGLISSPPGPVDLAYSLSFSPGNGVGCTAPPADLTCPTIVSPRHMLFRLHNVFYQQDVVSFLSSWKVFNPLTVLVCVSWAQWQHKCFWLLRCDPWIFNQLIRTTLRVNNRE